jgi:hypothetical protein
VRGRSPGKAFGGVGGPDHHDQIGARYGASGVVSGVGDRRRSREVTGADDLAALGDRRHLAGVLRRCEEPHIVPVLRPIEGHPTTAVARAEYRDLHRIPSLSVHVKRTL